MSDKTLGITLKTSYDGSGNAAFRDDTKKSEETAKRAAAEIQAKYEESFRSIRNAGAVAFAAISAAGTYASHEAAKDQESQVRLAASIRNTGKDYADYKGRIDATLASSEKLGQTNEEVYSVLSRMTDMTRDAGQALDVLPVAMDLAAARGVDLATAADAVSRASEGVVGRLGLLLPGLQDEIAALGQNATRAEIAAVALEHLKQVKGRASEMSHTAAGAEREMRVQMAETVDAIGSAYLPSYQAAIQVISNAAHGLRLFAEEHPGTVSAVGTTALAVTGLTAATGLFGIGIMKLPAAMAAVRTGMAALISTTGLLSIAAAGAAAAIGILIYIHQDWQNRQRETTKGLADNAEQMRNFRGQLGLTGQEYDIVLDYAKMHNIENVKAIETVNALAAKYGNIHDAIRAFTGATVLSTTAISSHAEAVKVDTSALSDMMNMGWSAAEALDYLRKGGAVISTVTVETAKPEEYGPAYDPMALAVQRATAMKAMSDAESALVKMGMDEFVAAEIRKTSSTSEEIAKRGELWRQSMESQTRNVQIFADTYQSAIQTATNMDMSGTKRREIIWKSFYSRAIGWLGNLIWQETVGAVIRRAADASVTAASIAGNATQAASTYGVVMPALATETTGVVALTAAYWALAIAKAAATGGLGSLFGFSEGGIVPGFARGGVVPQYFAGGGSPFIPRGTDTVPAMLTPGERVIDRRSYQNNQMGIERAIAGQSGSSVTSLSVTVNDPQGKLGFADRLELTSWLKSELPAILRQLFQERELKVAVA